MGIARRLGLRRDVPVEWLGAAAPGAPRNVLDSRVRLMRHDGGHPRMRDLTGVWDGHDDEVVLVYGAGSGEDVVGLLLHSEPRLVVGAEPDAQAVDAARAWLALHGDVRWRAILWELRAHGLPVHEERFDFVSCRTALTRAPDPLPALREIARLLTSAGHAIVTTASRESVWAHLHVGYERKVRDGAHRGLRLEEAYAVEAGAFPIERLWRPQDFLKLCRKAGLAGEFLGGYFSRAELACVDRSLREALECGSLAEESRRFLGRLSFDDRGHPTYEGRPAGLGGTYRLRKT